MKKKLIVMLSVVCMVSVMLYAQELTRKDRETTYRELEIFSDALHHVQTKYVEHKKAEELIYGALDGLLNSLDPYSQFLNPDDYRELLVETGGKFGGLGIEITIKDGLLTIISPLEDTPAWRAGIKAGDLIVKIEDELTRGIRLNDAVKKLRGKPGTKVALTLLREKTGKLFEVTITREVIKIRDIRRQVILEDNIGYIRLTEFREQTPKQLTSAIESLQAQGVQGLIFDLRNNPGGLLQSAVEVASRFVPAGTLVVYTLDREKKKTDYNASLMTKRIVDLPLVVLVNSGSASGSEIVAGCLKDHKRAVIVGTKTFGKASVQTVINLGDDSALRLTTARYYTPSGTLIQDTGIVPDIIIELEEISTEQTTEDKIFKKVEEQEDKEKDKEKDKDFYKKDPQIIRALDLVRALMILSKK